MSAGLEVRVMVEDAWDQVTLDLPSSTRLADVKQQALTLTHRTEDASRYLVKFRGAELSDETRSLAESGVVTRSSLIVMPRGRRPVR
jgi:hypothetical protein